MGCIESIENKVAQTEERIRQVIEADEYFVQNMQFVATTHKFGQAHILGDFQFMVSDPETKTLLRKFLKQLRDVDFVQTAFLFHSISQKQWESKRENKLCAALFDGNSSLNSTGLDLKSSQQVSLSNKQNLIPLDRQGAGSLAPVDEKVKRVNVHDYYEKNYAQLLINREKELQEKWTELYNRYKTVEKERRKQIREVRQREEQKQEELQKKWDENKRRWDLLQEQKEQERQKKLKEEADQKARAKAGVKEEPKFQSNENQAQQDSGKQDQRLEDKNEQLEEQNQLQVPEEPPFDPSTQERPVTMSIQERVQLDLQDFLFWMKNEKPPQVHQVEDWSLLDDHEIFWRKGLKSITKGKVALVLLAGDSGEKLGDNLPRGFYRPGLASGKCFFQLFFERIIAVQRLAGAYRPDKFNFQIDVYIMTSQENDEITRKLFRDNLNFGYWKKNIHFFKQGQFPCVDHEGSLLMEDRLKLQLQPDGKGGVYEAIEREGLLEEWAKKGIEFIHFMGVDNLLAKPIDPLLIGMLKGSEGRSRQLDLVTKYVDRIAGEKSSRVVMQGNSIGVVKSNQIGSNESKFNEVFIGNFAVRRELIETFIKNKNDWITYHMSLKKIPFYIPPDAEGVEGQKISLDSIPKKNAVQFKKSIFDPWRLVKPERFGLLRVDRHEEYAPIKHADEVVENQDPIQLNCTTLEELAEAVEKQLAKLGKTPQAAILQMSELHKIWLLRAGYPINVGSSTQKVSGLEWESEVEVAEKVHKEKTQSKEQAKIEQPADKNVAQQDADKKDQPAKEKTNKKAWWDFSLDRNVPGKFRENQEYYRLYEIDASQTYTGENIKPFDKKEAKVDNLITPYYHKGEISASKPDLPFGLAEIYRFV